MLREPRCLHALAHDEGSYTRHPRPDVDGGAISKAANEALSEMAPLRCTRFCVTQCHQPEALASIPSHSRLEVQAWFGS